MADMANSPNLNLSGKVKDHALGMRTLHIIRNFLVKRVLWVEQFWNVHPQKLDCEIFADHESWIPRKHQERKIGFKSVQLFKDQSLGIGSYGAVYKAKCDDLLCATPNSFKFHLNKYTGYQLKGSNKNEFLSTIRHPNIVQYLCKILTLVFYC